MSRISPRWEKGVVGGGGAHATYNLWTLCFAKHGNIGLPWGKTGRGARQDTATFILILRETMPVTD